MRLIVDLLFAHLLFFISAFLLSLVIVANMAGDSGSPIVLVGLLLAPVIFTVSVIIGVSAYIRNHSSKKGEKENEP